jgi:histone-lysine N-methyltransferase SETMAR
VPKKFKTKASAGKVMLAVFWKSERVVIADFLQKGATVNPEHYIKTLKSLKKHIMRKGAEIYILFQQNNARPHVTATTIDAIARLGFTVLPHQAHSSDLAPSDFHLFPTLKDYLRDQNFNSGEEVKAAVCQWFQEKEKYFLMTDLKTC